MASGNTLVTLTAQDNQPPAANFALLDTRNSQSILAFDPSTNWDAIFRSVLPRNYAGGGITVTIIWTAASATSGDTVWLGSFERDQDGTDNIDTDSFAATQTVTSTAPGVNGVYKYAVITFTNGAQIDNLAVGEGFRFKLTRNATAGGDTMTGNAQVVSVELKET